MSGESQVKVNIVASSKNYDDKTQETDVLVSIKTPNGKRSSVDCVCVVDVSGSMGTEAKVRNQKGARETHGLSLLDVVKHSVKTTINFLNANDRLALVVFDSIAEIIFDFIEMNEAGKKKALSALESLRPKNMTNLWDGLKTGLNLLSKVKDSSRFGSLLLLTDGQPNQIPPEGHIPALQKYKDEHTIDCTINTFGFGYELENGLLEKLAIEGNGMYGFIPDSSFVGTIFVNAVSNLLCTMSKNSILSLETSDDCSIIGGSNLGGYPCQFTSWGMQINVGSLRYEQSRDFIFRMKIPREETNTPFLKASLKYKDINGNQHSAIEEFDGWNGTREQDIEVHLHRLDAVASIQKAMDMMEQGKSHAAEGIQRLTKTIETSETAKLPQVQGLLEDLRGQVSEAFSRKDYYKKWGALYLPSLCSAHSLQICNNFKDPGVQFYGGKLFQELQDQADNIFLKLPPPKPSCKPRAAPPPSMRVYHSRSNPCFHPSCMVEMYDGSLKRVEDLRKGDVVRTPSRKSATIVCVLKTICESGFADLVELEGGLLITPYHPIHVNNQWAFPISFGTVSQVSCDAVFSFVLDNEHIMIINGTSCVSLGHYFQEEIVNHPYFGSRKIIDDLEKMSGWRNGLIQLNSGCLQRDPHTNLICGFSVAL